MRDDRFGHSVQVASARSDHGHAASGPPPVPWRQEPGRSLTLDRAQTRTCQRRRFVGATLDWKLRSLCQKVEEDPKQCDYKAVGVPGLFLSDARSFSGDIEGHKHGETDHESSNAVEAVMALRNRSRRCKCMNPPRPWPAEGPFVVQDVDMVPKPSRRDHKRWIEATGRVVRLPGQVHERRGFALGVNFPGLDPGELNGGNTT